MEIGYTMPPPNPKQSPEERQAELAPIVGPYSEKRRKSVSYTHLTLPTTPYV